MPTVSPMDLTAPQKVGSTTQTPSAAHAEPAKQVDTVEGIATPQTEEKPALSKEDALFAKRQAALAREQKSVREMARKAQAEVQAMKAKLEQYESSYIDKSKLAQDPLSILSELGVTYDQLTQAALNQPSPENQAISRLQREIQEMKQAQDNAAKKSQEHADQQVEQALKQMSNDAKILSDGNEKYEMIALHGDDAYETVARLIKHDFDETGVIKPLEQVMDEVEEMLTEQALALAKAKKLQAKQAAQAPKEPVATQKSQPQLQKTSTATLSNRAVPLSKPLTAKDRRERAIAAFMGKNLD